MTQPIDNVPKSSSLVRVVSDADSLVPEESVQTEENQRPRTARAPGERSRLQASGGFQVDSTLLDLLHTTCR